MIIMIGFSIEIILEEIILSLEKTIISITIKQDLTQELEKEIRY